MSYYAKWPLFFGGLALSFSSFLVSAERSSDISGSMARNTVIEFYRAIQEHQCEDAVKLRPGYSKNACLNTTNVNLVNVFPVNIAPLLMESGLTVIEIDIHLTKNGVPEDWNGFLTVLNEKDRYIILNDSYLSASKAGSQEGYLNSSIYRSIFESLMRRGSETEPDIEQALPVLTAPAAIQPSYLASIDLNRPASGIEVSRTFPTTSDSLLQSCWTPQELRARPDERKIKTRLPVDSTPPEKTVPAIVQPNPMPGIARSIRSVKPHNGEKLIALTFDLCEKSNEVTGYDGELVDTLRAEGVRATFYAGGKWMRSHPERTMQLMADPLFELGNHAWTHGNLRVLRGQEVEDQIQWTQAQYEILRAELLNRPCATTLPPHQTHTIPASLATFRFPYGTCNLESLNQVASAGLYPIQWDVVTGDPAKAQTANLIVKEILNRARPGSIVIGHANGRGRHTAEALKTLIPALRERGYRFVTVSELLNSGEAVTAETCYEQRPGDNQRYDRLFGRGTE